MDNLKKSLFEKLVQKTKELGRRVSFSEMREDPNMPDPNQYAFYYGSFDGASKMAEVTVKLAGKTKPKEKLDLAAKKGSLDKAKEVGKMSENIENIKEVEQTEKVEKIDKTDKAEKVEQTQKDEQIEKAEKAKKAKKGFKNVRKRWTTDEIKEIIRKYYDEYGKIPSNEWLCSKNGTPQAITVKRHLGKDKRDWLKAIGIEEPKKAELPTLTTSGDLASGKDVLRDEASNEKVVDNKQVDTCDVERELIDLIGQNGKLKQLGDMSDLMTDVKIEKQFVLKFGRIRATINLLATIDE